MTLQTGTQNHLENDLESVAWLMEQLAIDAGRMPERPRIRRVLDEAVGAWPPGDEDRWWRWLLEAGRSLGLNCKIIDCTFEQIVALSREGAYILTRVGEERQWRAIIGTKGRRFRLLSPLLGQPYSWVRAGRLRHLLGLDGSDSVARCLVIGPTLGHDDDEPSLRERTPLNRLLALMRPEAGDIWIIAIFSLVSGLLGLATPMAVETLVNTVAFGRLLQPVVILALMLFAFLAFNSALRALQTYVVEIIQRRLFARIAADLAYRLPRVDLEELEGRSGRELVNRFFEVVTIQKVVSQFFLDGISLVLTTFIGMAVLAFYHPWLLGFDVALLVLILVIIFVLGRGAVPTSLEESKKKYQMAEWLESLIASPLAFRYADAAEFALERADRLIYEYLRCRKAHFRVLMRQIVFALTLQAVASTVLLGLGGWLVISGQLTLGQLVAAELIVTVIVGGVAKFGKHMESFYDVLASADKLGQLFDLHLETEDGLLTFPVDQPAQVSIGQLSYQDNADNTVFDGLDVRIASGERVMLVGPSGSGKSILLDLLFGSRKPASGHVVINGVNPRDLRPDALRRSVVLVRDIEIFPGTLAENIHLERPEVSTNDVREALRMTGLLETVLRLPQGLETPLVETGYPLTPNQARKLMVARAIAGRPRLLMIDGILDSLPDEEAERLTTMLVGTEQPWTLIMVTGRHHLAQLGSSLLEFQPRRSAFSEEPSHVR
ncbi:MAG: hypothetical protein KatS3mg111_0412 [Pirellulaceae bacterium]|nr:MAG: hypothetical protein KatS3mg111_0412 [Pirellulaceae bacterium]